MEWCEESCSRPGEVGISEERVPMWTEEEEARLKEKENASRKVMILLIYIFIIIITTS